MSYFWLKRLLSLSPASELVTALLVRSTALATTFLVLKLSKRALGSAHKRSAIVCGTSGNLSQGKRLRGIILVTDLFQLSQVQMDELV